MAARGDVYRQKGEIDKALDDLNRLLDSKPNHSFALAARGDVYRQKGEVDKALTDLNRLLDSKPNHSFALAARGDVYRQKGEVDKASIDFYRAQKLESKNKKSLTDLHSLLGIEPNPLLALARVAMFIEKKPIR